MLLHDLRFAWRQVRRAPAFAASAVLTLAIGVGANTGIFSLLNGYWRPLPVPDADRLVVIAADVPGDDGGLWYRFSYPALNDYRAQTGDVFSDVFAFDTRIGGLTAGGRTTQFVFQPVSGNLFEALRLTPHIGRLIAPGEGERVGSEPLLVLGYKHWTTRFGADAAVVGTSVRVDGVSTRIVGVAPPGFHGLYQGPEVEGYLTIASMRGRSTEPGRVFTDRSLRVLTMMARMRPGVSIARAQSAVDAVALRLQQEYPTVEQNVTARVLPETSARPTPQRKIAGLLPMIRASGFGLATLVLLIACMNVANLLLVRATGRQREMAVRTALGSGRWRLVQVLLVESLVLGVAGTALGLVFARWATDLFLATVDPTFQLPLNLDYQFDWRVFAYAAAVAVFTGLLLGVVPAARASRAPISSVLHDGGHGTSTGGARLRLRSALVVAQVAGSLVLLVVAGLFVRSLQRAQSVDVGFDPSRAVTVRLDPRQVGYSRARTAQFYDELERRLEALPGVEAAGASFTIPMGYLFDSTMVVPEGEPVDRPDAERLVGSNTVSAGFFDAIGLPIVAGRAFTEHDDEDSRLVLIVNETMAKQFWPGEEPIGKRLAIPRLAGGELWEVVGVARDSKYIAVFEAPTPHFYLPMAQNFTYMRVLYVRTSVPPATMLTAVEREALALEPEIPVADLRTLAQAVEGGVGFLLFRMGATQAGAMGILGLLLAVVGVYGVVSYGATQRVREIGIRVALGARPQHVRALVLRQGAGLVAGGIAAGLVAASGVTRLIARFFVLVSSTDLLTFTAVTALLGLTALGACYLPARRATRVDPIVALRHE